MTTTIDGTSVTLGRDPDNLKRFVFTVSVSSRNKARLKAQNVVDPTSAINSQQVISAVGAAAGLAAEYLADKYGDVVDPERCATDAIKAMGEELRLFKEVQTTFRDKVKRLKSFAYKLSNQQLEAVKRFQWLLDKQQSITPQEAQAIDEMIGDLHGDQL